MMKLLFAISLMSVCLLLVMARFVRFDDEPRSSLIEEDSVRDDLGLSSPLKMQMQQKCLQDEERCIAFWECCSFYCDNWFCASGVPVHPKQESLFKFKLQVLVLNDNVTSGKAVGTS